MIEIDDTIIALSSASGSGAIMVVRMSGKHSLDIAKKITQKNSFTPRYAHLCKLFDEQEIIDEAIVIYFKAPHSFTGEDIIEFQIHGNEIIASIIIKLACKYGARIARNGEFSKRAVINNKLDISQAIAISKLIEAKSNEGVKLLARQLKGELKNFVSTIRDNLVNLLAFVEVSIDYAEEDIPKDIYNNIQNKIDNIIWQLDKTLTASQQREGLIDGFKIAIVGKPNVGKSSFLNRLLNYERAIVSDIEGTTRDTVEESIKIGQHLVRIVDTAGIRQANDTVEKIGIERSKKAIDEADIIIAIFDSSKKFDNSDKDILQLLENSKDVIYILNKSDLKQQFNYNLKDAIKLSIKKDNSIDEVVKKIEEILDKNSNYKETMLVSLSQIELVNKAKNDLIEAKNRLINNELELFAYHVNNAIESISNISKPYDYNELLDEMFSNFCLGK